MPRQLKAARLWTAVAAALLLAGAVSAMGTGGPQAAPPSVAFSTAI